MKKFAFLGQVLAVCALVAATPAEASVIVWKDPVHGFSMTYPDTWTVQTQDVPSTRLRVAAPIGEDIATCRMQAKRDGRLKIYPKRLMMEAVEETLDEKFWQTELEAAYPNGRIDSFYSPASLGSKGDATAIRFAFSQNRKPMYGFMMASIYQNTLYVVSCTSLHEQYSRWAELFISVVDSVEFADRYHPFATGYYRDFLADPKLYLPRTKPGTINMRRYFFLPNKYNE